MRYVLVLIACACLLTSSTATLQNEGIFDLIRRKTKFHFNPYFFKKQKLIDFKKKIYSQFGEDGIIDKIFEIIGSKSKICVEFGSADGIWLSNTANLWKNKEWKAILIESDPEAFKLLVQNTKGYNCVSLNQKVGIGPEDNIEAILDSLGMKEPIDLLSIDIDGSDYHIFENLHTIQPRVIICEYNPTIPAHLKIYPEYNNHMGCSIGALKAVAKKKGYSLVALTSTNAFFVLKKDFHKFSRFETSLRKLFLDEFIRYVITDYDGKYKVIANDCFRDPYGMNEKSTTILKGKFKTTSSFP